MKQSVEHKGTHVAAEELQNLFFRLHQRIKADFQKKAKDMCSLSQMEALRFIHERKNSSMKDLARHLGISAPSATVMIEHLVERKLAARKIDPKDRRTVHIHPTQKTTKLFSSIQDFKRKIFDSMMKGLNEEEKNNLAAILKKIV